MCTWGGWNHLRGEWTDYCELECADLYKYKRIPFVFRESIPTRPTPNSTHSLAKPRKSDRMKGVEFLRIDSNEVQRFEFDAPD